MRTVDTFFAKSALVNVFVDGTSSDWEETSRVLDVVGEVDVPDEPVIGLVVSVDDAPYVNVFVSPPRSSG